MADRSQRTEQPTARKLEKARGDGNVPRSRELPGALSLIGFLIFTHLFGRDWLGRLNEMLIDSFSNVARPDLTPSDTVILLGTTAMTVAMLLGAPLGIFVAAGVGGNLVQGRPPLTLKPLQPDLSKLNPIKGLKKVVRLKSWVEGLKTALKMGLFAGVALAAVRESLLEGTLGAPGAEGAVASLFALAGKVIFRIALVTLALAVFDLLYTRYDHLRGLRMTKQEVKDERKESEGDPTVKARVRSRQMTLARSRMMADVERATVVVTNPTQYAVAMRFVPGEMEVPQLLAKGRAKLAERIRAIATDRGIPIVSDPPLARALYRSVQVGALIPPKLFRAVAEVLALVLRSRGRPGGTPPPQGDAR